MQNFPALTGSFGIQALPLAGTSGSSPLWDIQSYRHVRCNAAYGSQTPSFINYHGIHVQFKTTQYDCVISSRLFVRRTEKDANVTDRWRSVRHCSRQSSVTRITLLMDIAPLFSSQPLSVPPLPPSTTTANMRRSRRQNRIPGRLRRRIYLLRCGSGRREHGPRANSQCQWEDDGRPDTRWAAEIAREDSESRRTTDDGTSRCVKLADKSDMMTTYRACQPDANDMDCSSPLFQVVTDVSPYPSTTCQQLGLMDAGCD